MRHITIRRMMVATALLALVFVFVFRVPMIVEHLRDPVPVARWSPSGLILTDGRTISLPEIQTLPTSSLALSDAIRNGVELSDGRVYGLIRVHHWCGGDSMRHHIARVDLSHMLLFLGEGVPKGTLNPDLQIWTAQSVGGRFTARGWEVGEYYTFRLWSRHAEEQGSPFLPSPSRGAASSPASPPETGTAKAVKRSQGAGKRPV